MIPANQVLTKLAQANPIPDPTEVEVEAEAATYLTTLERRSSKMTQLDTETEQQTNGKTSNGMWLVAAASAAILGVALLLINQGSDEASVATQLTPPTIADAVPTTVADVTPTTLTPTTILDPAEAAWQEITPFLGRGRGEFRTISFAIPLSFDTGDSLWNGESYNGPDIFGILFDEMIVLIDVALVPDSVDATVQAFANWQANYPDSQMTEPAPTHVGDAEGLVFETFGLPLVDDAAPFLDPDGASLAGGEFAEVSVIEVNGQVLIVSHRFAKSFPGHAIPAYEQEEYDAANASARAIIDSIIWKDLS